MTHSPFTIVCQDCRQRSVAAPEAASDPRATPGATSPGIPDYCPHCGSQWRDAEYDYNRLGPKLPGLLAQRAFGLWRYRELLPVLDYMPAYSLGRRRYPFAACHQPGDDAGLPQSVHQRRAPGADASFKDRQAAVNIAAMKESEALPKSVLASTGNVAMAYSAYAARQGSSFGLS